MGLFSRAPDDGPFDRATLELPSGEVRTLTPREFEALPLDERVSAILGKRLKFFRGGKEIPLKVALSHLR